MLRLRRMSESEHSYERFLKAVHQTVFLFDREADRVLAETLGGTFSQFMVLMAIAQCQGLSQQKIAAFLQLTPAAVSRQVDGLVEAKLIARKQDPHSRRSYVVSLTEAGEKRFGAMKTVLIEAFKRSAPADIKQLDAASATMESLVETMLPSDRDHS